MGTQGLTSPRLAAFQSDVFPRGLDLGRSVVLQDIGVFKAAEAETFEAGMLVGLNASQEIIKCVGAAVLGVAKWNKVNTYTAPVIDEEVSFPTANSTVNLKHANVSNVVVRATANQGSPYTVTTDYTVNAVNGTLTHVGAGAIPVATTVFVSYTYQLTAADLDFQGRNFFNFTDDVSIADGRITVVTDSAMLFTAQYDVSRTYGLTGTASNLFCGGGVTAALAGLFTNDSGEGDYVGSVIQLPTADDPFLGVRLGGDPVEQ